MEDVSSDSSDADDNGRKFSQDVVEFPFKLDRGRPPPPLLSSNGLPPLEKPTDVLDDVEDLSLLIGVEDESVDDVVAVDDDAFEGSV